MKKLITILTIAIGIVSCDTKTDQQVKDYNIGKVGNLKQVILTIEIDSCEYLAGHVPNGDMGWVMTHKGNCKFCKQRINK